MVLQSEILIVRFRMRNELISCSDYCCWLMERTTGWRAYAPYRSPFILNIHIYLFIYYYFFIFVHCERRLMAVINIIVVRNVDAYHGARRRSQYAIVHGYFRATLYASIGMICNGSLSDESRKIPHICDAESKWTDKGQKQPNKNEITNEQFRCVAWLLVSNAVRHQTI